MDSKIQPGNENFRPFFRPALLHLAPALYAAFDTYPTAKGASTHIYHFARTLFAHRGGGWLHVLGSPKLNPYQYDAETRVETTRFEAEIPNFLKRVQVYEAELFRLLQGQDHLQIAHFRDPWSGVPVLRQQKKAGYRTVYEINGLPSIELPYRYPQISPETLHKIRQREQWCWQEADALLVPSGVIRDNLVRLGAAREKITVIHNGADIPETFVPLEDRPPRYILYFGALQSWQGLPVLLKAFDFLRDLEDLHLVICSANRLKFAKHYLKMVEKMATRERIHWHFQLAKRPLYQWVREAALTVAPLSECSRNLEQGCCPLKVLESMALGTPVVASDLPAVREIIATPELGYLVRPDRPAVLARALRVLLEHPEKIAEMGQKAQEHIRQHFTWAQKEAELSAFYSQLLGQV